MESVVRYQIPMSQNLPHLLRACEEILDLPLSRCYELDFVAMQHCEPFGLLLLGAAIRSLRMRDVSPGTPVTVTILGRTDHGSQGHGFAKDMGFWWSIAEDKERPVNLRSASEHYVRVDRISVSQLYREAGGADPIRSEIVSRKAAELAKVLARGGSGPVWQALEYSFREMLRNAIEHSQSDVVWFAAWARYKQSDPDVQVAILDEGRGIRKSLLENVAYVPKNDQEAIEMSILPGVSRNAGRHRSDEKTRQLLEDFPDQDPGLWDNSGFGLYMTSELAKRAGQFAIVSGDTCVAFVGPTKVVSSTKHQGVAIRISFDPRQLGKAMDEVFAQATAERKSAAQATKLVSASMKKRLGIDDK